MDDKINLVSLLFSLNLLSRLGAAIQQEEEKGQVLATTFALLITRGVGKRVSNKCKYNETFLIKYVSFDAMHYFMNVIFSCNKGSSSFITRDSLQNLSENREFQYSTRGSISETFSKNCRVIKKNKLHLLLKE